MLSKSFLLFFFLACALCSFSQVETDTFKNSVADSEIKILEDTLVILGYAMINDSSEINRFASCQKFIRLLVKALKNENSFDYPFQRLKTVSILYPPDSTFRIFSWQVYDDINHYHYYGSIQMNEPQLKMFPLIDRSEQISDPESALLEPSNWYGQLYYNIRSFESAAGKTYLLFGYDAYRFFTKRKLAEPLIFKNGTPVFGAPVFEKNENGETRSVNRLVFEYSSDAKFKLNYDENQDMVLFDHLIPMGSPYPGQELMFVPDGDVDGYYLDDKIWKFKARVFDQILDEAPRPQPVLGEKKDLFGKE